MTYKPEYEVGLKSPGVWKEVRRLEAEVERLRMTPRDDLLVVANERDTYKAEVERLQASLVDWTTGVPWQAEVKRLQAEYERLGEEARMYYDEIQRKEAEVERLRRIEEAAKEAEEVLLWGFSELGLQEFERRRGNLRNALAEEKE
jgi:TPP-dependent trihydroxycyclohexane-1,2-dione (THcHDO) dehydratase